MQTTLFNSNEQSATFEKCKLICQITPANFDMLTKVLSLLEEQGIIIIQDSKICQHINKDTAILQTNIDTLIGKNINFEILDAKKYIRLFKVIRGDNDIKLYDDENNKRYIITNDIITIFIPQRDKTIEEISLPAISEETILGQPLSFNQDTKDVIQNLIKSENYTNLIIHQNQLKGIYVPETCVYLFPEFMEEKNVNESTAELLLKTYSFIRINGEDYNLSLHKVGSKYWILNHVNTGFVNINIFEELIPDTSDSDDLFL